jgi:hypothetical protein
LAAPSPVPDRGRLGIACAAGLLGDVGRWGHVVGPLWLIGGGFHLTWRGLTAGIGSPLGGPSHLGRPGLTVGFGCPCAGVGLILERTGDIMTGKLPPHVLFTTGKGSDCYGEESVDWLVEASPKALPKA